MFKNIIAIDGPAASGKGTVARSLAARLNFAHMDTGALYRAVAFEVLKTGMSVRDHADAIRAAHIMAKKIQNASSPDEVLGNPSLREDKIGQQASKIAAHPKVRQALTQIQRDFAAKPPRGYQGAILDGRDIGTVICPDAPLKLYITASVEIRARRRLKELQSKLLDVTYSTVLEDMRERDARDAGRDVAPLKPADDAIILDSSDLNAGEMLEKAYALAQQRLTL